MKIRPLHDRILIKRLEEQEQKKGGIIIPDTAKEKPQEGKVIAVGNGKVSDEGKKIPLDVKAGDKILFGKYSGSEVKIDDEEYLIMREEDVLAIIEWGRGGCRRGIPERKPPAGLDPAHSKRSKRRDNDGEAGHVQR
jgi:chaperonin GroES